MRRSTKLTEQIISILSNRRGFDDWFENLEEEFQKEIKKEIESAILDEYDEL